jgi:ABC-type nickel/cobalt efflux system permease component RcnA
MKHSVKNFLITLLFLATVLLGTPLVVRADKYGISDTAGAVGDLLPTSIGTARTIPEFIGVVIKIVLSFLAIVFFLLIFYAGLLWMVARGNPENISKAKSMMESATIGLVIVIASYGIARFVFQGLTTGQTGVSGVSTTKSSTVDCTRVTLREECLSNSSCYWKSRSSPGCIYAKDTHMAFCLALNNKPDCNANNSDPHQCQWIDTKNQCVSDIIE